MTIKNEALHFFFSWNESFIEKKLRFVRNKLTKIDHEHAPFT